MSIDPDFGFNPFKHDTQDEYEESPRAGPGHWLSSEDTTAASSDWPSAYFHPSAQKADSRRIKKKYRSKTSYSLESRLHQPAQDSYRSLPSSGLPPPFEEKHATSFDFSDFDIHELRKALAYSQVLFLEYQECILQLDDQLQQEQSKTQRLAQIIHQFDQFFQTKFSAQYQQIALDTKGRNQANLDGTDEKRQDGIRNSSYMGMKYEQEHTPTHLSEISEAKNVSESADSHATSSNESVDQTGSTSMDAQQHPAGNRKPNKLASWRKSGHSPKVENVKRNAGATEESNEDYLHKSALYSRFSSLAIRNDSSTVASTTSPSTPATTEHDEDSAHGQPPHSTAGATVNAECDASISTAPSIRNEKAHTNSMRYRKCGIFRHVDSLEIDAPFSDDDFDSYSEDCMRSDVDSLGISVRDETCSPSNEDGDDHDTVREPGPIEKEIRWPGLMTECHDISNASTTRSHLVSSVTERLRRGGISPSHSQRLDEGTDPIVSDLVLNVTDRIRRLKRKKKLTLPV